MKVFGKQGENYIVSVPKLELLQIVFGLTYPDMSNAKIKEFVSAIDCKEVEIEASKIFTKMVDLHSTDLTQNYHGLVAKIDALKGLLTPIDNYIKERKPKAE